VRRIGADVGGTSIDVILDDREGGLEPEPARAADGG
jgi:hypothetical protein